MHKQIFTFKPETREFFKVFYIYNEKNQIQRNKKATDFRVFYFFI